MRTPRPAPLSIFTGVSVFPTALGLLLCTPRLWLYALPPVILSFAAIGFLFTWIRAKIELWFLLWLSARFGGWLAEHVSIGSFVYGVMNFISWSLTLIATTLAFSWVYLLLAIPFADPLAEATEKTLGILPDAQIGPSFLRRTFIDILKTFVTILLQLATLGITIIFFWVPGIQVVAFIANAYLLAFQYLSYAQTRRGLGVGASLRLLSDRPFVTFAFGATAAAVLFVPYISAFLTPIAIVAGTVLFARLEGRGRTDDEPELP